MNKQHYQKLEEKIKEACPDIMELKFGCEILRYKNNSDGRKYKVIEDMGFAGNDKMVWINSVPFGSMQLPIELLKSEIGDDTGDWKIIGRPITLEDCILALQNKKGIAVSTGDFEGCEEDEKCIKEEYNVQYDFRKLLYLWIPNKPLQDQPEETLTLLYNLICKK